MVKDGGHDLYLYLWGLLCHPRMDPKFRLWTLRCGYHSCYVLEQVDDVQKVRYYSKVSY